MELAGYATLWSVRRLMGTCPHLLSRREGRVGVTAADDRLFIEAVLYRY